MVSHINFERLLSGYFRTIFSWPLMTSCCRRTSWLRWHLHCREPEKISKLHTVDYAPEVSGVTVSGLASDTCAVWGHWSDGDRSASGHLLQTGNVKLWVSSGGSSGAADGQLPCFQVLNDEHHQCAALWLEETSAVTYFVYRHWVVCLIILLKLSCIHCLLCSGQFEQEMDQPQQNWTM